MRKQQQQQKNGQQNNRSRSHWNRPMQNQQQFHTMKVIDFELSAKLKFWYLMQTLLSFHHDTGLLYQTIALMSKALKGRLTTLPHWLIDINDRLMDTFLLVVRMWIKKVARSEMVSNISRLIMGRMNLTLCAWDYIIFGCSPFLLPVQLRASCYIQSSTTWLLDNYLESRQESTLS